jgi:hypothetical protein
MMDYGKMIKMINDSVKGVIPSPASQTHLLLTTVKPTCTINSGQSAIGVITPMGKAYRRHVNLPLLYALVDKNGYVREINREDKFKLTATQLWDIVRPASNPELFKRLSVKLSRQHGDKWIDKFCKYPFLHIDDCTTEASIHIETIQRTKGELRVLCYRVGDGAPSSSELVLDTSRLNSIPSAITIHNDVATSVDVNTNTLFEFTAIEKSQDFELLDLAKVRFIWHQFIKLGFRVE